MPDPQCYDCLRFAGCHLAAAPPPHTFHPCSLRRTYKDMYNEIIELKADVKKLTKENQELATNLSTLKKEEINFEVKATLDKYQKELLRSLKGLAEASDESISFAKTEAQIEYLCGIEIGIRAAISRVRKTFLYFKKENCE